MSAESVVGIRMKELNQLMLTLEYDALNLFKRYLTASKFKSLHLFITFNKNLNNKKTFLCMFIARVDIFPTICFRVLSTDIVQKSHGIPVRDKNSESYLEGFLVN